VHPGPFPDSFAESFAESWVRRYGSLPSTPVEVLAPFLAHRSVRKYTGEPIPTDVLHALMAAAQSASTSSNLQLWSAVRVTDPDLRKRMAELCGNQRQVETCAEFFAFLADHHRLREAARAQGIEPDALGACEFYTMAVVDAALAAERMVCAAEAVGIGICYIGSLRNDPQGVAEALALPTGTFGLFGLCLGYPQPGPEVKPRLAPTSVFFENRYGEADTAEYDARMAEFYAAQGMNVDEPWSMRSGKRATPPALGGREGQLEWLRAYGFLAS